MGGSMLVINVGSDEWNYQVNDLAVVVAKEIPGTKVDINPNATPDKRSYRVDFTKFRELAPNYQPQISLIEAVRGLRDGLQRMDFSNGDFKSSNLIRLNVLNSLIGSNILTDNLTWIK